MSHSRRVRPHREGTHVVISWKCLGDSGALPDSSTIRVPKRCLEVFNGKYGIYVQSFHACIQSCPSRAHGMSYSRRVRPHKEGTHVERSAGPHPSRKGIRVAAELVPPRGGTQRAAATHSSLQGGCPHRLARVPVRHKSFAHPGGTNVVDYFCH